MAHLHTRKKGRSGSKRPASKAVPAWVEYSKEDVEGLVLKLQKEGQSLPAIGAILRDTYGIPRVKLLCGKTVNQILAEHNVAPQYPPDMINLIIRAVNLREHLKTNKRDALNITKLNHIESKIRRLVAYYRKEGTLPEDWQYNPETAALLVK